MADLSIGLNGLNVALAAIDVIGNNIANGATEGFHRQEVAIVPVSCGGTGGITAGGGARVTDVRRIVDTVVENEILRQTPLLAQVSKELDPLQTVEGTVGDMSDKGLGASIDSFFGALQQLAGQPDSAILRDQVCGAADAMTAQFHDGAASITSLGTNLRVEGGTLVDQLNSLAAEVADLNRQLALVTNQGKSNSNLADRRDEDVKKMTGLLNLQVQPNGDGTVNLMAGGTGIVMGAQVTKLELGTSDTGKLGLSVAGSHSYNLDVSGGTIGGILSLTNDLLPALSDNFDTLARTISQGINQVHVQGIGTDGSFDELDGSTVTQDLGSWQPPVTAGTVYIRMTDTSTGQVARYGVAIDPAADSLDDVAARFNAIPGLSAAVTNGHLHLETDSGHQFDFVPALLPEASTSTLTGTAQPTVSGAYTGAENQTLSFRVVGSGSVGVTDGLAVEVTDGSGNVIRSLKVGQGYRAGDVLAASDGVQVAFSAGTLTDGETFTIDALASSDTAGFLSAAGLNTFFAGNAAATIDLAADVRQSVGRVATSCEAGGLDNTAIARMAAVGNTPVAALGGLTVGDSCRRLVADVGQEVSLREGRQQGLQASMTQLDNQRADTSGVDLNEQAAQLMIFEQLFQTMAKYMTSANQMQQSLMAVIGTT